MKKQTRIILGVTVLVITILLVKNILFDKSIKEQIFEIVNDKHKQYLPI